MWANSLRLLPSLLLLWPLQVYAGNFTFSYGQATQCDGFAVSWRGGVAPFHLTIVPAYGTPRIFDVPNNAFSNNQGTFSTTLLYPAGKKLLAIMSDSSGFASGGVSDVIIVGASVSNSNCNTTDPGVAFYYDADSALAQCRTYTFSNYDQAIQPIIIKGVVPGGSSFILTPPTGPTFDWIADVAAGTQVAFFMQDAQGRQGGATDFTAVSMSDDSTCLDKNSPSSVSNAPSMTSSTQAPSKTKSGNTSATSIHSHTSTSTAAPDAGSSNSSSSAGTIAAAIVGTIVALVVVGSLIWFYLRRRNGGTSVLKGGFFRRRFRKQEIDLVKGDTGLPPPASLNPYPLYHQQDFFSDVSTPNSTADLLPAGRQSDAASSAYGAPSTINFASRFPPSIRGDDAGSQIGGGSVYGGVSQIGGGSVYGGASQYGNGSQFGAVPAFGGIPAARQEGSVTSWDQSATSSAMQRKAAMAGVSAYQAPARFILHTDLEDEIPPPPVDEVIELPPQYTERRKPPPGASSLASGSEATPQDPRLSPGLAYLEGDRDDASSISQYGTASRPS